MADSDQVVAAGGFCAPMVHPLFDDSRIVERIEEVGTARMMFEYMIYEVGHATDGRTSFDADLAEKGFAPWDRMMLAPDLMEEGHWL